VVNFAPGSRLRRIERYPFAGTNMESICIPPLVEFIDGSAFLYTELKAETITLNNSHFAFRDDFSVDGPQTSLISYFGGDLTVRIPCRVTQIAARCFCSRGYSHSVSFQSDCGIVGLEDELFAQSRLQSIVLPASVGILGKKCFRDCHELISVSFESPSRLRRNEEEAFDSCTALSEILCSRCFQGCGCLKSVVIH
jgi:hypothetical protein